MSPTLRFFATSTPLHLSFAFLAMGAWSVWVNSGHTWPQAMSAGLVQGSMSAILTLLLKKSVDGLRAHFRGHMRFWTPPAIASLASAGLLIAGHSLARTPELLATIGLPLGVSATYVFAYNIFKSRGA